MGNKKKNQTNEQFERQEFDKCVKQIDINSSLELSDDILNNKIGIDINNDREEQLNNVLKSFSADFDRRSKTNKDLKKIFLIWTMTLFSIIVVSSIVVLVLSLINLSIYSIAPTISSVGTLITSFIVLPRIIARYLFPEGETKDTIDLVTRIATHGIEMQTIDKDKKK